MSISFDSEDLDALRDALKAEAKAVQDAAYQAGIEVSAEVARRARAAAPKDRPFLSTASGIRTKAWRDRRGSHSDVYTAQDSEGRNVGFFVEYGTSDTPPNPFLTSQMEWAGDAFAHRVVQLYEPLKGM